MPTNPIEVFCDAGISPASMEGPTTSRIQPTLVGRIVLVVPMLDYGYIEQVNEGITSKKGNPSSNIVEVLAVRRAKEICAEKKLTNYVIYTDNTSAAETAAAPEIKWLEAGRLQLASLLLQRIVNRARYLRQSSRKVINRAPPNEAQRDAFLLFNAEKLEFKLSKSALWNKIQTDIAAARGAGQQRLEI